MEFETLADIVLAPNEEGKLTAFLAKEFPAKKQPYKIDKQPVTDVITFPFHDFVLLRTAKGAYLRNRNNASIEDENWSDHYFEPHTSSLYRQDQRGNWYDLEGFQLASPIFLKGDVLISLSGKTSKQSWAFGDQKVIISPHAYFIQVGKLVFDRNLEQVHYFGEKVTGLGRKHVSFGKKDQWQEVMLGLRKRAFINEFSGVPLLINDEEIAGHVGGVTRGARHFEVFRSENRTYVLEDDSSDDLRFDGQPLEIDLDSYLVIDNKEVVMASLEGSDFYLELGDRTPFLIEELGKERITDIGKEPVRMEGALLYNVRTAHRRVCYDQESGSLFRIGDEYPEVVREVPGFEEYYFTVKLNGRYRLCNKASRQLIEVGDDRLQLTKILSKPGAKLLNTQTLSGNQVVLDVRLGLRNPLLATADGQKITRVIGPSARVGDMVLQHVEIESLGGSVRRVIDLEEKELKLFALPKSLTVYPDQPETSSFADKVILQIDFLNPITVQGQSYFEGVFLSDMGDERKVILQSGNARPLHLDGARHRNELVTGFKDQTVSSPHKLGVHKMVSVTTLNEELEEGEMLVSIETGRSWLPFYDTFLPVFRRAIYMPEIATWGCVLFEVLGPGGGGEYVAVEKNKPYRVLARKSRRKVEPRIITSKTRVLTDPEEMSALAKFFLDPGMLVEVG